MADRQQIRGIIAWILLAIYVGAIGFMVVRVFNCGRDATCNAVTFNDRLLATVTAIGGLVSALVVARLAVAKPAQPVSIAGSSGKLAVGYVAAWLLLGFAALVVGVLVYPDVNQSVSDLGTAWLGIAVTAGFAYFGIDPEA